MEKSKRRADEIINHHITRIKEQGLSDLLSVILVGSLSDHSYSGNKGSDIDLIHILKDGATIEAKNILYQFIEESEKEMNYDIPISKCIFYYKDFFRPFFNEIKREDRNYFELPIEIFRIKESGIILYGEDIVKNIDLPTRDDIIEVYTLEKQYKSELSIKDPVFAEKYEYNINNPTIQLLVQIVITGAMKDYYFATGYSCSSKLAVLDRIKRDVPKYQFVRLLELCVAWRYNPEIISSDDEMYMKEQYLVWRFVREDMPIDFVPLCG